MKRSQNQGEPALRAEIDRLRFRAGHEGGVWYQSPQIITKLVGELGDLCGREQWPGRSQALNWINAHDFLLVA